MMESDSFYVERKMKYVGNDEPRNHKVASSTYVRMIRTCINHFPGR